eukprot:TRINITY_DN292_c0_g1_i3.p2 TRINITY_DN292_c0_g1~~TRINITY_DN292_c0_g1_i3.p2  ORF type:complete len:247 (-),score=74.63 TRINITY_DN292_c0_g1_i3:1120-1860(-)
MAFTSVVKIDVKRAFGLKDEDLIGLSDPFVSIKFAEGEAYPAMQKTKVVKDNLNPVWDETFYFLVKDDCKVYTFELSDEDLIRDDKLGRVTIDRESDWDKREQVIGGSLQILNGKGQLEVYVREFAIFEGVESAEQFKRDNYHMLRVLMQSSAAPAKGEAASSAFAKLTFPEEGRSALKELRTKHLKNDGSQFLEIVVPERMLSFKSEIVVGAAEVDVRSRPIKHKVSSSSEYELSYDTRDFAAFF